MKKSFITIGSLIISMYLVQSWASEVKIIDADTIELNGAKVRLHGIDAPEIRQKCEDINTKRYGCGISSRDALQSLILKMPGKMVECKYIGMDMYNRFIGECRIGEININMWLVENGWALAYLKYSKKYAKNENNAKGNRVGIWSGKFVKPWDWRRGKRLNTKIPKSKNKCLIKGNISSDGERIYHLEDAQNYNQTRISTERGERWFCSFEEAEEHGWRRSKQ